MSDVLILLKDAAKIVGLAETTVKGYMNKVEKFSSYRMERSNDGKLVFSELDINLLISINKLKKIKGMTIDEAIKQAIADILDISYKSKKSDETTTDLSDMSDVKDVSDISNQVVTIMSDISDIKAINQLLTVEIRQMREESNKREEEMKQEIKTLGNKYEQSKVEELRLMLEIKKAIAEAAPATASQVKENKKKWWKFWQ
ncbi:MerR family transcriptional regulator [Bacillus xiapuensis]|uniref:MerR family transcriptional regulator n=1 Tax=Bacillus xiapuensis TaxID=2014075 RepID=A0ABU6NFM8_9BACI|nr:MerR family transcriptional regulator [Bacillus xiapuensis]